MSIDINNLATSGDSDKVSQTGTKVNGKPDPNADPGLDPANNPDSGTDPEGGEGDEGGSEDPILSLNEAGDLVNEAGEVIKKKGEFEVDDEGNVTYEDDEAPMIDALRKEAESRGLEFGEDDVFTDDVDGYFELAKKMATKMFQTDVQKEREMFPELGLVRDYLINGGDLASYLKNKADLGNLLKLDDSSSEEDKKRVIRAYIDKTVSDPQIASFTFQSMIDAGEIDENFKKAKVGLKALDDKQAEAEAAQRQAMIDTQLVEIEKINNEVASIVQKGVVSGIEIPAKEREGFRKFLLGDYDGKGNPEAAYAYQNLSTEDKVKLDYILYKGFNLKDLVASEVRKNKVEGLNKRKLGGKLNTVKTAKIGKVKGTGNPNVHVSLSNLA